jgi:hypothetical protein
MTAYLRCGVTHPSFPEASQTEVLGMLSALDSIYNYLVAEIDRRDHNRRAEQAVQAWALAGARWMKKWIGDLPYLVNCFTS